MRPAAAIVNDGIGGAAAGPMGGVASTAGPTPLKVWTTSEASLSSAVSDDRGRIATPSASVAKLDMAMMRRRTGAHREAVGEQLHGRTLQTSLNQ